MQTSPTSRAPPATPKPDTPTPTPPAGSEQSGGAKPEEGAKVVEDVLQTGQECFKMTEADGKKGHRPDEEFATIKAESTSKKGYQFMIFQYNNAIVDFYLTKDV